MSVGVASPHRSVRDILLGAVCLVIGLFLLASTYRQSAAVFVLPGDAPPFLVPQVILVLWTALSAGIILAGLIRRVPKVGELANPRWGAIFAAAAVIGAAIALLKPLGFLVVAPVAAVLVTRILGMRNWWLNIVVALVGVASLYLLLDKAARLPLPPVPGFGI